IGRAFKAIDNDTTDPVLNAAIRELQDAMMPVVPRRIGNAPKCLSMWRCAEPFGKVQIKFTAPNGSAAGLLELLGQSQYWNVDGLHPSGKPYTYEGSHPADTRAASWATITVEQLRAFGKAAIGRAQQLGYTAEVTQGKASLDGREHERERRCV